jgi:hypothetical protein
MSTTSGRTPTSAGWSGWSSGEFDRHSAGGDWTQWPWSGRTEPMSPGFARLVQSTNNQVAGFGYRTP